MIAERNWFFINNERRAINFEHGHHKKPFGNILLCNCAHLLSDTKDERGICNKTNNNDNTE